MTQAEILVDGEEIPLLDGSAQPWVEAIGEAQLAPLQTAPSPLTLEAPITLQQGSSFATALPAAGLRVGAAIEFADRAIGRQLYSLELTPKASWRRLPQLARLACVPRWISCAQLA